MGGLNLDAGTLWKAKDGRIVRIDGWSAATPLAEPTASCTVVSRLAKYQRAQTSFRRKSFGTFLLPEARKGSDAP